MKTKFLYIIKNPITIFNYLVNKNRVIWIDGYPHTKNFGDALTTPLVEFLSEKKVLPSKNISRFLFNLFQFDNYAVIGSILQWSKKNSIVWGAGFISPTKTFYKPKEVLAVRGPLSRKIFLENAIDCPEVYGDPALILPLIYYPKIEKKYKYGIIPHYYDFNHEWVNSMKNQKDVLVIDLMVYTDYQLVVNQILSCEKILSTSLHGVIVSDAYKVPNIHISISDKVMGSEFKFEDYYQSVGKKGEITVNPIGLDLDSLYFSSSTIKINLEKLINACPFITSKKREYLVNKLKTDSWFEHLNNSENEN